MNPLAVPVLRGLREAMLTEAQQSAGAWSLCRRHALRAATARGLLALGLLALALGPLARALALARGLKCRKAWGSCPHPGGG